MLGTLTFLRWQVESEVGETMQNGATAGICENCLIKLLYTQSMSKKSLPYFFLAFLFAILLFILGVRYGQYIEQINKTVSYLISLPPSPTVAPTFPPLGFSTYLHTDCGVSFLVPNLIEKTKESSTSALFSTKEKKLAIALSCEKKPFIQSKEEKVSTLNALRVFETATPEATSYRIFNPKNSLVVTVTASKEYLLLIQKSLTLVK
jgi:hypothetical protein